MDFAALFPDDDYRFQMRLERGAPEEFFAHTAEHDAVVAERRLWLAQEQSRYCACRSQGGPLLDEAIELMRGWHALSNEQMKFLARTESIDARCALLGEMLEPDLLLLKPGATGEFELVSGCVCFPSSWSLSEKIGRPLSFIHDAVPGLNSQIGKAIHVFLGKLTPGIAWRRHNWGLSRSPELNQHPQRNLPPLDASVALTDVWLRVEHQALVALPRTQGVLFGIRIAIHPLADVKRQPRAAERLARALESMPAEVADYKHIAAVRPRIVDFLTADN
jgi:hypothetical protein